MKENLKIGDTVECKDLGDMWDCEEIKQGLHILHVTEIEVVEA